MTDFQKAQLRSFKATLGVSVNHHEAWKNIPALVKYFGQLAEVINLVSPTAAAQQGEGSEPVSAVKKQTRATLARRAADVAALLHAHADDSKDIALLGESDQTYDALRRKPEADLLSLAQRLHTLATTHATALVEQGLEPDELANLRASIEKFAGELGAPQVAIAEGSAQTKALKIHFRAGMSLYRNRLDKLMERFKTRDRLFYDAYRSARQIS